MFSLTIACSGCWLMPAPWNLRYVDPNYVYVAWGIVACSIIALILPFMMGYRLGGRVPYSLRRHIAFTLILALFPFVTFFSPYPLSFGTSLLQLIYLPCLILLLLVSGFVSNMANGWFSFITLAFFYLVYCGVAARILLRFDHWIYKKGSVDPGEEYPAQKPEAEPENRPNKE